MRDKKGQVDDSLFYLLDIKEGVVTSRNRVLVITQHRNALWADKKYICSKLNQVICSF